MACRSRTSPTATRHWRPRACGLEMQCWCGTGSTAAALCDVRWSHTSLRRARHCSFRRVNECRRKPSRPAGATGVGHPRGGRAAAGPAGVVQRRRCVPRPSSDPPPGAPPPHTQSVLMSAGAYGTGGVLAQDAARRRSVQRRHQPARRRQVPHCVPRPVAGVAQGSPLGMPRAHSRRCSSTRCTCCPSRSRNRCGFCQAWLVCDGRQHGGRRSGRRVE